MITDPVFYLAAIPAVLLFGIAKGGFAGGFGIVAVPIMALVIPPVQAAGILLPILCVMDLASLWAYRGKWVLPELRIIVPASLVGIATGAMLAGMLNASLIRLLLGIVALLFTLHYWATNRRADGIALPNFGATTGIIAAAVSGFTSFIAHAGGPPLGMYLLRRGLDRTQFVATTVVFFAIANYVKLLPYGWLGQLDAGNLKTSLVLSPLAPLGIAIGVWMHRRVSDRYFFRMAYGMLFLVGIKLTWDGMTGL